MSDKSSVNLINSTFLAECLLFMDDIYMYGHPTHRRLEVWLDHVVAKRAARATCTGMSIILA